MTGRPGSRRARIGAAAATVILASACASSSGSTAGSTHTPFGGDPGNRLLHRLAADPIFAQLPPRATRTAWTEHPAKYRTTPFEGAGWDGPSVALRFTCSRPILEVYRFFGERAQDTGWTARAKGSLGVTMGWSKHYQQAYATVSLFIDKPNDTRLPRAYSLLAGITSIPAGPTRPGHSH